MIGPEFFDTWQCDASISEHRDGAKITFEMASNRALLARLVDRVNTLFADFDTAERVKLTIVVRELVDNAIVHGNHESLSSEVRCELLRTGPGEVRVRVRDEGAGFDYASLDLGPA